MFIRKISGEHVKYFPLLILILILNKYENENILLIVLISSACFISTRTFAQDVSINVTPLQSSILNFTYGYLEVKLCNEDPDVIAADPNKLRPQISFPENLTIVEILNKDFTPVTNFTIQSLVNDPGNHTVRLLYNVSLQNADCIAFLIKFEGNEVGDGVITATLGFQGPQTPGNLTANDNSLASTPVDANLPVTLQEFNVSAQENTVNLDWITTEEINSDHFELQRSDNGKEWSTFQTVKAMGDSRESHTYTAVDRNPFEGENLYRLHMVDTDGSSAYSRIRRVVFEGESAILFPNPVSDVLNFKLDDWADVVGISIEDMSGTEVYKSGSKISKSINVASFKPGIYVVQLMNRTGKATNYKILISR